MSSSDKHLINQVENSLAGNKGFTCPVCGSPYWGTGSWQGPADEWTRFCKGQLVDPDHPRKGYIGCSFTWLGKDDHLYGLGLAVKAGGYTLIGAGVAGNDLREPSSSSGQSLRGSGDRKG